MRLAEYCALLDERAPLANRLTKRAIAHATAIELATVEDPRAIREVLDALAFSTRLWIARRRPACRATPLPRPTSAPDRHRTRRAPRPRSIRTASGGVAALVSRLSSALPLRQRSHLTIASPLVYHDGGRGGA